MMPHAPGQGGPRHLVPCKNSCPVSAPMPAPMTPACWAGADEGGREEAQTTAILPVADSHGSGRGPRPKQAARLLPGPLGPSQWHPAHGSRGWAALRSQRRVPRPSMGSHQVLPLAADEALGLGTSQPSLRWELPAPDLLGSQASGHTVASSPAQPPGELPQRMQAQVGDCQHHIHGDPVWQSQSSRPK